MEKSIMLIGSTGSGKSSLIKALKGENGEATKTVVPEYHQKMLDTPGEYVEHRPFYGRLQVMASDYKMVGLLIACDHTESYFPPHITQIFGNKPCIGIISKIDLASPTIIEQCRQKLTEAGVTTIIELSTKNNQGLDRLREIITKSEKI